MDNRVPRQFDSEVVGVDPFDIGVFKSRHEALNVCFVKQLFVFLNRYKNVRGVSVPHEVRVILSPLGRDDAAVWGAI